MVKVSVIMIIIPERLCVFHMTCLYTNLSQCKTQITQSFPEVVGGIR